MSSHPPLASTDIPAVITDYDRRLNKLIAAAYAVGDDRLVNALGEGKISFKRRLAAAPPAQVEALTRHALACLPGDDVPDPEATER